MNIGILNCKSLLSLKSKLVISFNCRFVSKNILIKFKFNKYNYSLSRQKIQGFKSNRINLATNNGYHKSILHFKIKHNIIYKLAINEGITNTKILNNINEFVLITKYYINWYNSKTKRDYIIENNDSVLKILHEHQHDIEDLEHYKQFTKNKIFKKTLIEKLSI